MAIEKTEMKRKVAKTKAIIGSNAPARPQRITEPVTVEQPELEDAVSSK